MAVWQDQQKIQTIIEEIKEQRVAYAEQAVISDEYGPGLTPLVERILEEIAPIEEFIGMRKEIR